MFDEKYYAKMYRKRHKDKIKEYQRVYMKEYRKSHRDYFNLWCKSPKGRESIKKWRESTRGKMFRKASDLRRRIKKGNISMKVIQSIYEDNIKKYGTLTCYLCLNPIVFGRDTIEHKTPISRGGNNDKNNLDIACQLCNTKKYNKTVEEYYREKTKVS